MAVFVLGWGKSGRGGCRRLSGRLLLCSDPACAGLAKRFRVPCGVSGQISQIANMNAHSYTQEYEDAHTHSHILRSNAPSCTPARPQARFGPRQWHQPILQVITACRTRASAGGLRLGHAGRPRGRRGPPCVAPALHPRPSVRVGCLGRGRRSPGSATSPRRGGINVVQRARWVLCAGAAGRGGGVRWQPGVRLAGQRRRGGAGD